MKWMVLLPLKCNVKPKKDNLGVCKMDWEKTKSILYAFGIMVGIILVVALLVSQIIMPIAVGKAKEVIVPDLVGKNMNEANAASVESQLHISEASM
jgi:regulatory protein YycI of two-component signal transduction system YycFG